ncbi:MAG: nuclear transport factor 2 family protein [Microbacteriaceae bacterium]|nr:nuclear transport factor 2 family protein [Microbacteriaceae bacterium]
MTMPSADTRAAIDDLYATYLWALDLQDIDDYVSVFWDDAVLKETQLDGTIEVWRGAPAIRAFTEGHFGGYGGHQHRETTRRYLPVPGRDDQWVLLSYWFASHREPTTNEIAFFSTGLSRDVVEARDGVWRFAERGISRWPADPRAALQAIADA